jgi:hypothetical protein
MKYFLLLAAGILLLQRGVSAAFPLFPGQTYRAEQSGTVFSSSEEQAAKAGGAFLRSLIFPSWGERYAGQGERGKWFLRSELVLLAGFAGYRVYGRWQEKEYLSYAEEHAGIHRGDQDHAWFVNLGIYDSVAEYNEDMTRRNRFSDRYTSEEFFWDWDSPQNRLSFRRIRLASDDAYATSLLLAGGIFVNHVLSAIHALRLAPGGPLQVSLHPFDKKRLVSLTYRF